MTPATHWRLHRVTPSGHLIPPVAGPGPYGRLIWPEHGTAKAWCQHHPQPPEPQCECGLRGMDEPEDILAFAAMLNWLDTATWRIHWMISHQVVIAISQAELSGRLEGPSPADPPRVTRAAAASLACPLYLSVNGWSWPDRADRLATRYGHPVLPLADLIEECQARALGHPPPPGTPSGRHDWTAVDMADFGVSVPDASRDFIRWAHGKLTITTGPE